MTLDLEAASLQNEPLSIGFFVVDRVRLGILPPFAIALAASCINPPCQLICVANTPLDP